MSVYSLRNLIYQILSLGILFFANTYINGFLIPDSFKWEDGQIREDLTLLALTQFLILFAEGFILYYGIRKINQRYLNSASIENTNEILNWTSGLFIAVTIFFIVYLLYLGYSE